MKTPDVRAEWLAKRAERIDVKEYEIISRDEFAEILEGAASLGGEGASDESAESSDDTEEEPPKGKSKPKSRRGDDEGSEESSGGGSAEEPGAWYSTGYGEGERLSDREAAGGDDKAWRFYLNQGQETEVVVLDSGEDDKKKWDRKASAPFNVWEHNFAVVNPDDPDDLTFHDITCVRGKLDSHGKPRRCYVCERKKKIRRRFRSMYTVLSKYNGKKGEAWSKKLLPADKACLKKFKRHSKKHGLFGMKFNVFRSDDRSSRIGDDWSYDSTLSEQEVQDLLGERQDLSPVDYVEECRPMSWDELENLLKDAIISDPKKRKGKGSKRRASRDDDDDRPRGRDRDDDEKSPRRSSRDEDDEDKPRRRSRDDEKDEGEADEKPTRRPRRDDDEKDVTPRRRGEKDEEGAESESDAEDDDEEGSESEDVEESESEEQQEAPASGAADEDIPF